MTTRRFGPTLGAGTVIVEKDAQKPIEQASLGSTAYTGILQKGPVGKLFAALNTTQYVFKAGGRIPESLVPDAAFSFFSRGQGAGTLWLNRVTDGSEKKSDRTSKNRKAIKGEVIKFSAGNGGRWGGKKAQIVDEYASVTATTVTLTNVPASLKLDELVGGKVRFNAIAGKTFDIIASSIAGVITVPSDINLIAELNGSADALISVELANDGRSIAIKIKDGLDKPTTEWGLDIYLVEGSVFELIKSFPNLSSDPDSINYFLDTINDDSDSEFLLSVADLNNDSITADIRPANVFGLSLGLTDTVITAKVHDEVVSSAALATMKADPLTLGASVIKDIVTLTNTAAGARSAGLLSFGATPDDDDDVVINGRTITFKTAVADPLNEVLIGASAATARDNLVAFINADADALVKDKLFAEATGADMDLFAATAGTAGDALTTVSNGGANKPTFGGATLAAGAAQTWTYASANMPFLTGLVITSGVSFASPNQFGSGFTLIDTSKNSTKNFAIADTVKLEICPLEVGKLVDGFLTPNKAERRKTFQIIANTANTITVKTGSLMLADATLGDDFRVEYIQELAGGYDGVAGVDDQDFLDAYDISNSPLRSIRGKNAGLVKLGSPGVTAVAVQKAGAAFGESQNWHYRYEVPANITDEQAAEEFLTDQIGTNDFSKVTFPSFARITNPDGPGLKLISMTGSIHGREALIAKNFQGFHKAAAGTDVTLPEIVKLPVGMEDKILDEEFLNPKNIGIIKLSGGNFVIWGDRMFGTDPAFKFAHQRETMSHYENIFLESFDFTIFAINDEGTEKSLHSSLVAFFLPEFSKGAIRGDSFSDAVEIKIDAENNTNLTRANGDLNAQLRLRLADSVERFIITMSKLGVTESSEL